MAIGSTTQIPHSVETALKKAAEITGVDFQYLVDTAARESGFRASVKAPTSSASGLFQFIESTWLQMVKDKGPELGLGDVAKHITKDGKGNYRVEDRQMRREILELRNKPEVAALMAGAFTQQNATHLEGQIGRKPTSGELYIAHFLGAHNGSRLVKAATLKPEMQAADLFPQAARSNKSLFYRRGKPVSVKGLYQNLVRRHHVQHTVVAEKTTSAKTVAESKSVNVVPELAAIARTAPLDGAILKKTGVETVAGVELVAGGERVAAVTSAGKTNLPDGFFKAQASALMETKKGIKPVAMRDDAGLSASGREDGAIGVWNGFAAELKVSNADGALKKDTSYGAIQGNLHDQNFQVAERTSQGNGRGPRPILETGSGVRGLFQKGGLGTAKG